MNRRLYVCIVLLLIVCSSNDFRNNRRQESYPIVVDSIIINKYPSIHRFIEDSLINGQWPYRLGVFDHLRKSDDHLLNFVSVSFITKKKTPDLTLGGNTKGPVPDTTKGQLTRDTIYLNSWYLQNGSREYISQVIIHESIHAFINWCTYSYHHGKNGVTESFLQTHIGKNWEWIKNSSEYLAGDSQHIIMADKYIDTIKQCFRMYTNPNSPVEVKDVITQLLSWGGLEKTPQWKEQRDTCLMKCVDIESRNFNAPKHAKAHDDCCDKRKIEIFLKPLKRFFRPVK